MSVPSDLQRGREVLLVVVALIRWAAMFGPLTTHQTVCSGGSGGFPLLVAKSDVNSLP